jgi:hydrophobic/amphiphilic exporter-1 (mainly G- bacteria), HAE1 family
MNLAKIAIRRPTFITAILAALLVVGFIMMQRMPVDMFPDVNFPFIMVQTVYPGAGPKEVETLITKKVETQISSIAGLKNVTSTSQDGFSMVFGEFTLETDPKYAEQQVKDKVALIRNDLPTDIKEPVIRRYDPADTPILILALKGNLSPTELYNLADTTVRNKFEQVPNVGSVDIIGGTKREIHVDLDRAKMKDYETSLTMVSNRITQNSQNIPIGKVSAGAKEISFRSIGEYRSIKQIKDVVVNFFASDVPVTLDKIGVVTDGSEDAKTLGYLNGVPSLVIDVYKQSKSNTVNVSDGLLKRVKQLNSEMKSMKGTPELVVVRDGGRPIRMNVADVRNTIFEGILLAILVVYLFLGNFRSTFITAAALPTSLIGAFIFMALAGFSVNMLTLMALSLVVGLLIDDAIVVRENIFRHIEMGETPMVAAQKGTDEVRLAVIATTLAIVAVFLPVAFLQGMVGQFFKSFGLTIVFAMGISLFDALTTAPMLSAYMIGKLKKDEEYKGIGKILHAPAASFGKFQDWLDSYYHKVMLFVLDPKPIFDVSFKLFAKFNIRLKLLHRGVVLLGALLIFIGSLGLVKGMPMTFMSKNEWGEFTVSLQAAPGTSLDKMREYADQIDRLLRADKDVEMTQLTVGNTSGESNVADFFVKMVPTAKRSQSTSDMKEHVRKMLSPYKETLEPAVNDIGMAGDEKPFFLLIRGEDIEKCAQVADSLMPKLKTIKGLVDLDSNYKPGKPEFQVKMDPMKMQKLGVASIVAGMELRGMVEGTTPAKFREDGEEYDIRVRLLENQRDLSKDFGILYVPNVNNQLVRVKNIAEPLETTGPSKVYRRNRGRYVAVSGNTDQKGAIGNITAAAKEIVAKEKLPEGVSLEFLGASEDMADLFSNMVIAALLSIVFIYLVLASLYESILVPFTIMIALPLAIVGGLIALAITGMAISMFTMIGFIMLLGLTTKNSILLVDLTQKLECEGLSQEEALIKAGLTRLRPILMTTFALIAGMLPLALALTEIGRFRQSMGIAIIGGLLSSTVLTLVVVPAVYGYIDTFRLRMRKLMHRPAERTIDCKDPSRLGL